MTAEERIRRIEQALERYYKSLREGKRHQRRYGWHRSYFRTSELELPGKYGRQKEFMFLDVDKRERKPPGIGSRQLLAR